MSEPLQEPLLSDAEAARVVKRMSRRGFLIAAGTAAVGAASYGWLKTRPTEDGIAWPLRKILDLNGGIASKLSSNGRLSQEFPATRARMPRVNGVIGLTDEIDVDAWRLRVFGITDTKTPLELSLNDIKSLPRVEVITQLRCIEGWSEIVHWTGARISDLVARYPLLLGAAHIGNGEAQHVAATTPDGEYYVGVALKSALHPQTLLCYAMNGEDLEPEHGAPVRLVLPVKYGIKSLKCVGNLRFTTDRPPDYWAQRGYDYHAGF